MENSVEKKKECAQGLLGVAQRYEKMIEMKERVISIL